MVAGRVPPPPRKGPTGRVLRRLLRLRRSLEAGPAERLTVPALHRLHRDLRRAVVEIQTLYDRSPADARKAARAARRSLRRIARLAGAARDPDVHAKLLADARGTLGSRSASPWARHWASALARESRARRRALERGIRREWVGSLETNLSSAPALLDPRSSVLPPIASWRRSADRHSRQVLGSLDRARRRPSAKRLHRLRQSIREARLFDSVADDLGVPVARTAPPEVRRLQSRLGRLHDLDEFRAVVDAIGPPRRGDRVWARIDRERRTLRRRLERAIRTKGLERTLRAWRADGTTPARGPRTAA